MLPYTPRSSRHHIDSEDSSETCAAGDRLVMTMHHRPMATSIEQRRASMDVRRSMDVSRRLSVDTRQRRDSSLLSSNSGFLQYIAVDEEVATASELYHSQVPSRPATPLLQEGPERSSTSLPDMQRMPELQRPATPSSARASGRSPFASGQHQHGKQRASGVFKAVSLLMMLALCWLGVYSANQAARSFNPLVRRQLNTQGSRRMKPGAAGVRCELGRYASAAGCSQCPRGLTTTAPGATSVNACVAPAGSFIRVGEGRLCPRGSYTSDYNRANKCTKCGAGMTTAKAGSTSIAACIPRSTPGPDTTVVGETTEDLTELPSTSPVLSPSPSPGVADLSASPAPTDSGPTPILLPSPEPQMADPLPVASPVAGWPEVTDQTVGSSPSPSPSAVAGEGSTVAASPSPTPIDLSQIAVTAPVIGLDDP